MCAFLACLSQKVTQYFTCSGVLFRLPQKYLLSLYDLIFWPLSQSYSEQLDVLDSGFFLSKEYE